MSCRGTVPQIPPSGQDSGETRGRRTSWRSSAPVPEQLLAASCVQGLSQGPGPRDVCSPWSGARQGHPGSRLVYSLPGLWAASPDVTLEGIWCDSSASMFSPACVLTISLPERASCVPVALARWIASRSSRIVTPGPGFPTMLCGMLSHAYALEETTVFLGLNYFGILTVCLTHWLPTMGRIKEAVP